MFGSRQAGYGRRSVGPVRACTGGAVLSSVLSSTANNADEEARSSPSSVASFRSNRSLIPALGVFAARKAPRALRLLLGAATQPKVQPESPGCRFCAARASL